MEALEQTSHFMELTEWNQDSSLSRTGSVEMLPLQFMVLACPFHLFGTTITLRTVNHLINLG